MKSENNTQWDETYPKKEDFIEDINNKNLYVDEFEGDLIGFICIDSNQPEEYKGIDWISDEKAIVIHRMGVNPKFRGLGKAKNLIRYAENFAMNNDIMYIKTDTNSMNIKMYNLLKKCGFRFSGQIKLMGKEDPFYCYDLKLNIQ